MTEPEPTQEEIIEADQQRALNRACGAAADCVDVVTVYVALLLHDGTVIDRGFGTRQWELVKKVGTRMAGAETGDFPPDMTIDGG